ncbi:Hypp8417 [Branchiostoma lanceolatum]|uniref:Hypp8417 protein n=1 Tax=Branchiostoma lanceolatum TaxID=7740 RepID=A0A8K0EH90_BRALA|nr:Hypp8417 [Branchiostoma lanceolatum]
MIVTRKKEDLLSKVSVKPGKGPLAKELEPVMKNFNVRREMYQSRTFVGNHVNKMLHSKPIDELTSNVVTTMGTLCEKNDFTLYIIQLGKEVARKHEERVKLFAKCHKGYSQDCPTSVPSSPFYCVTIYYAASTYHPIIPPYEMDMPTDTPLEVFKTWKVDELRLFVKKRGLKLANFRKDELAALAFSACQMQLPIQPDKVAETKRLQVEYGKKLKELPDPSTLSGWVGEEEGCKNWPGLSFPDICVFVEDKDLRQYKDSKAYSYVTNGWLSEISYNPISKKSKYCFLKCECRHSQKINTPPHQVWCCIEKTTGRIRTAHCTCMAG